MQPTTAQIVLGLLLIFSTVFSVCFFIIGGIIMLLGKKGLSGYGALWLISQFAILGLGFFAGMRLLAYNVGSSGNIDPSVIPVWVGIVSWSIFAILAVSAIKLWKRGNRSYASWGLVALALGWLVPLAIGEILL